MTDMPKRIWINVEIEEMIGDLECLGDISDLGVKPQLNSLDKFCEYVRSDTLDARDATIAEMVEALDGVNGICDAFFSKEAAYEGMTYVQQKVRTALNRLASRVEKESE